MRRTTALWLGLMMALGTTTIAAADHGRGWGGKGFLDEHPRMERFHVERLERLTVLLDLSDQQVEEWRALHESRRENFQAGREELEALHDRIGELAESDDPDPAAVGRLVIEAHGKMSAHREERAAVHAEAMSILTPQQQERFEAIRSLHEDRPGRGARGRGRHPRHHGAPERD